MDHAGVDGQCSDTSPGEPFDVGELSSRMRIEIEGQGHEEFATLKPRRGVGELTCMRPTDHSVGPRCSRNDGQTESPVGAQPGHCDRHTTSRKVGLSPVHEAKPTESTDRSGPMQSR